jgi:hypothetical protein
MCNSLQRIHIINRALMLVCLSVLMSKRYGLSVTQKIPLLVVDRCELNWAAGSGRVLI